MVGAKMMYLLFGTSTPAKTSVGFAVCIFSMNTDLPESMSDFMAKILHRLIVASKELMEDSKYASHRHELRLASFVKEPVKITSERREYCGVIQRVWWGDPMPNTYEVTLSDGRVVKMSAADLRAGDYFEDGKLHHPIVAWDWAEFEKTSL